MEWIVLFSGIAGSSFGYLVLTRDRPHLPDDPAIRIPWGIIALSVFGILLVMP